MANSLFSSYSTAENKVTSVILTVFENLNPSTVKRILQILMEDSTVEIIEYESEVISYDSLRNGRIKGLFDYNIEIKLVTNSINTKVIKRNLKSLKYDFSRLLILTPDADHPASLKELDLEYTEKIIWGNFDRIIDGIDIVFQESILLLDREKFLLTELKEFIINQRLTTEDYSRKAVIIPLGPYYYLYEKYSFYRCQRNRTFKNSSYMGFYANKQIKEVFPKILGYIDCLNIQKDNLDTVKISTSNNSSIPAVRKKLYEIKKSLDPDEWNENYKFTILTELNDKETFINDHPIYNDAPSDSDKASAFHGKQTYLNLDDLKEKKYTSELEIIYD